MARRFYLIDGYNLLHAAGLARDHYAPGGFERQRVKLLNFLAYRLDIDERPRTTIVFDAAEGPTDSTRSNHFELMTVLFSPPSTDADTIIEELIALHANPQQLRVVSSDHRIQLAAKRRRAIIVESDEFFDELSERESQSPDVIPAKPPAPPSPPIPDAVSKPGMSKPTALPPLAGSSRHARPDDISDADWQAHIEKLESELRQSPKRRR